MNTQRWSRAVRVLAVLGLGAIPVVLADPVEDGLTNGWLAQPVASVDGLNVLPWACTAPFGVPDPGTQSILQMHFNWHCSFDNTLVPALGSLPNDGNRFFGFHRQFIFAFNRYRAANGAAFLQTWPPSPGGLIPVGHGARADNTACPTCQSLPNQYRVPAAGGTLSTATFPTIDALGNSIVFYHNTQHGRIANSGPGVNCTTGTSSTASDMCYPNVSPRDPIFYRYHNVFDDVQDTWMRLANTDVMVVFDRSGSMSIPDGGAGLTRLDAAKEAARLFADLLEDGSSHRVGLASFSTSASNPVDLGLTSAGSATAAMNTALTGIAAGGATSIGDGLQRALTELSSSTNPHKAILLLTDGVENTAPLISSVTGALGDTHLCSVGFGSPGTIDGAKLRDLSERQGGVYINGFDPVVNNLLVKKFFVECFADIFDTFVGSDPIALLPAGTLAGTPTVHIASGDEQVTFVLSWSTPEPAGNLRLAVTTPSGAPLDLNDPAVESRFGPTWHIVRVRLPYRGERDGSWLAYPVRPTRSYVNGFTPSAFAEYDQGVRIVTRQLTRLCPDGCQRVLYFEDGPGTLSHAHATVYGQALVDALARGFLGAVKRAGTPEDFAAALREGNYDLIVYASSYAKGNQPYDGALSERLCADQGARAIITDTRTSQGAQAILRCAGALRTEETNFEVMRSDGGLFSGSVKLSGSGHDHGTGNPFSYGLRSTGATGAAVQATSPKGAAVIARGDGGKEQRYFVNALTASSARVQPFTYRARNYTLESLHPTFHIPEMYWPATGFDRVEARVRVTRPLESLGRRLAELGLREGGSLGGDPLSPRQAGALKLDPNFGGRLVKTETLEFSLFDNGTSGDTSAIDRYWEASLPPEVTRFDGEYLLRAIFKLCKAGRCVQREASHSLVVDVKLDPGRTRVSLERLPPEGTLNRARVLIQPVDRSGLPLGPHRADALLVLPGPGVKLEGWRDFDGRGRYEIVVTYPANTQSRLLVGQFGRPKEVIAVALP
jgi:hypothetical protein